jgi:hypothetical protein
MRLGRIPDLLDSKRETFNVDIPFYGHMIEGLWVIAQQQLNPYEYEEIAQYLNDIVLEVYEQKKKMEME